MLISEAIILLIWKMLQLVFKQNLLQLVKQE